MSARAVVVIVQGDFELVVGRLESAHLDLEIVDALARLQLAARRIGCSVVLREASIDLCGLIDLAGLSESGLVVEPRREAEGREQFGVQEVVDAGDPSA